MAQVEWQVQKICYCERIGEEIVLETKVVFPSEQLPDQPPRVLARRCSNETMCNQFDRMMCVLCGTNPDYRPV